MGNRAHNRRHEGRAIRKARREVREYAQQAASGFTDFSRAAWKAGASLAAFAEGVQRFRAGIVRFGELSGLSALPAHDHSQEGSSAAERPLWPPVAMSDFVTDREDGSLS